MFKRPHSTKSSNLISTSARKKLIQQAQSEFFCSGQTSPEEQNQILNQIIPATINVAKAYTHLNHQLFIYHDNQNQPIWIKLDKGNGRLVPTVYTLLKYPNLLPILRTHQIVLEKLSQGADLMIPGLIQSDFPSIQDLKKDTLISIVPTDSIHLVWAVGFLAADGAQLVTSQTGKAVITIHTQADFLWNSGTKEIPGQIEILPTAPQKHSNIIPEPNEKQQAIQNEEKSSSELNGDQLVKLKRLTISPREGDLKEIQTSIVPAQSRREDDTQNIAHHTHPSSASSQLSPTEVDEILKQALLTSLWNQKVQSGIPMPGSQFYSDFILPYRHFECPRSTGVKDSSAKNLAKWLKNMNKLQFITIREDHKKRTETLVTGVNLDHPELEQFRKYRTIHDLEKSESTKNKDDPDDTNGHQNHSSGIDAESCLFQLPETKITSVFKATKNEGGWFWLIKVDLDPENLYTQQELKEKIINYVNKTINPTMIEKKSEAERKNKVDLNLVEPDDYLRSAMGNLPNAELIGFNRNQIVEFVLSNSFIHWWRLERNNQILIEKKGELPVITLKMKKKSGNKQSTLITGLEFFGIDPIRFSKEIKTLCAGSSTTRPIPHDPNNCNKMLKELLRDTKITNLSSLLEVECQGDQRNFLFNYLCSNTSISKHSMKIIK